MNCLVGLVVDRERCTIIATRCVLEKVRGYRNVVTSLLHITHVRCVSGKVEKRAGERKFLLLVPSIYQGRHILPACCTEIHLEGTETGTEICPPGYTFSSLRLEPITGLTEWVG